MILRKAFASNKTSEGTQDLINVINEAKNDIQIARTETAVKIAAARTEETEVRKQINEISKVKDKKKRLEALIQLEKSL